MNPQLVFFGEPSYLLADEKRGHQIMDTWISNMESDFDLILILEELDTSLALLVLKFCWEVRDALLAEIGRMGHAGSATIAGGATEKSPNQQHRASFTEGRG